MGMFNCVRFQCECRTCGNIVNGFQTKDGDCVFDTVMPWSVSSFYACCDVCKTWHQFDRKSDLVGTQQELLKEATEIIENLMAYNPEELYGYGLVLKRATDFLIKINPVIDTWLDDYTETTIEY